MRNREQLKPFSFFFFFFGVHRCKKGEIMSLFVVAVVVVAVVVVRHTSDSNAKSHLLDAADFLLHPASWCNFWMEMN